jgi:carbonic anhydrase
MRTINKDSQSAITPAMAIQLLREGNERFVKNLKFNRNLLQQVNETRDGQWPFAVILSCIDSRTSAELIFDQGLGDIFSIRIAGNIINEDILGSLEFATKVASAKLIVVLGHSNCGAIKGACDNVQLGNLTGLLTKIQPAINEETSVKNNRNSGNSEFVEKVAAINVKKTTESIKLKSDVLKQMIKNGQIGIIGAMYEVETGNVHFYHQTTS